MKIEEIRKKTEDQISSEMENLYKESLNLRFQKSNGQLTNTSKFNSTKKTIAKLLTFIDRKKNA